MKKTIQRAEERGRADYGWLQANYYFSFAQYYHPGKIHFGMLRVLNDDFIAGGGAFPPHPHDNMEIVTIPLSGAVKHEDSTGGKGLILAGDVQVMSAGSGVRHSEANGSSSELLNLFQIWIFPKEKNVVPRYEQRSFDKAESINQWQILVSPRPEDNGLFIHQDARFSMTRLSKGNSLEYKNGFAGNGVYLIVVDGDITIDGDRLLKRDAMGIHETDQFMIHAQEDAELLAIEVPMR